MIHNYLESIFIIIIINRVATPSSYIGPGGRIYLTNEGICGMQVHIATVYIYYIVYCIVLYCIVYCIIYIHYYIILYYL